jgi:hypothetical protein
LWKSIGQADEDGEFSQMIRRLALEGLDDDVGAVLHLEQSHLGIEVDLDDFNWDIFLKLNGINLKIVQ